MPGVCGQMNPYDEASKLLYRDAMSTGDSNRFADANGIPRNSYPPPDVAVPMIEPDGVVIVRTLVFMPIRYLCVRVCSLAC